MMHVLDSKADVAFVYGDSLVAMVLLQAFLDVNGVAVIRDDDCRYGFFVI